MTTPSGPARTVQDLLAELKSLVSEAEAALAGTPTGGGSAALNRLKDRFHTIQARFVSTCETAKENVIAGAHRTDRAIRENPYRALANAAGVGVLLGILAGRRTR